jgi:aminomethyltransferase
MSENAGAGYRALREGAAWLDLSSRGRLRASGEDRIRLLHAMSTNHIEQLKPGDGCYAFFLNAQGRILADAFIQALPDVLLISTEPETRASLYEHLDKYIIADDVVLEDVTYSTVQIGIEGPRAPATPAEGGTVLRFTTTGEPGFSIVAPTADRAAVVSAAEAAGAVHATPEAARIVRIENGRPRYSEDITDRYLPHETQVLSAVHFNKGCYLGQEIVERVRSRGGVHRFLAPLEIETESAPSAGAKITSEGREVGEITSAAFSPARGIVAALGYLRLNELPAGAYLTVDDSPARLTARHPR